MTAGRKKILIVLFSTLGVIFLILALLSKSANRILKYHLEKALGKDFTVEEIELTWGRVAAHKIQLSQEGEQAAAVEDLTMQADLLGFLKRQTVVSRLVLVKPFLKVRTDRKGKVILPWPQRDGGGGGGTPQETPQKQVRFKHITMSGGELLYLDGKVATPPYPVRLQGIELSVTDLSAPLENEWSACSLTAKLPGKARTGEIGWAGKTNFKTGDTDAKITLRNADLVTLRPYYHRKGDDEVTQGSLSIDMDMKIRSRSIHAPGKVVIRDLEFEPVKGLAGTFWGAPRSMVVNLLKSGNNEISLNFVVEGDLDNPRFSIREALIKRLTVRLAESLGLSVVEAGESILIQGAKGAGEVGKGIKGIGEELKKIFGR